MSVIDRDRVIDNWLDRLEDVEARVDDLERSAQTGTITILDVSTEDVSNPPTDAELDLLFGTPEEAGRGFLQAVDDDGAGSSVYLVFSDGVNWWYVALTKAT